MFTSKDLEQFEAKGISSAKVNQQIENFKSGFDFVNLQSAATPNHGLITTTPEEAQLLVDYYHKNSPAIEVLKFVPASGAASRMFKHLFEFREQIKNGEDQKELLKDQGFNSVYNFFNSITKFAFFESLKTTMAAQGHDLVALINQQEYGEILDYFLTEKGLNYGNLPKGLLLFHNYETTARLAIEEHLMEGINYAASDSNEVKIHFTVSENHKVLFQKAFDDLVPQYEKKFGVKIKIEMSIQKASTDTIAVDMNNEPFRLDDGSILFRPGGHGALIENLNDLDADVIFIKNIDNIVPDRLRDTTNFYKKVIGGLLLKVQNQAFSYLEKLEFAEVTDEELEAMKTFLEKDMHQHISKDYALFNRMEKVDYLYTQLNRPFRVCGMVKNEGEPGGGPFNVQKNGEISLQIVESSQIDFSKKDQADIVKNATHFNPVDLVCGIKNYRSEKFNLLDFVDAETGFISNKSKDGRDLKAQELPGLWNGAQANWNTLFVEVPIITFNPVKTINDLLRDQHQ